VLILLLTSAHLKEKKNPDKPPTHPLSFYNYPALPSLTSCYAADLENSCRHAFRANSILVSRAAAGRHRSEAGRHVRWHNREKVTQKHPESLLLRLGSWKSVLQK